MEFSRTLGNMIKLGGIRTDSVIQILRNLFENPIYHFVIYHFSKWLSMAFVKCYMEKFFFFFFLAIRLKMLLLKVKEVSLFLDFNFHCESLGSRNRCNISQI